MSNIVDNFFMGLVYVANAEGVFEVVNGKTGLGIKRLQNFQSKRMVKHALCVGIYVV